MRTYPPCWVLKVRIQKHRGKPLLFHDKCPGFFYVHYTTHMTYSFTSHLKDEAIMIKCLPQGHKRRDRPDRNSNQHSDNTRTWVQCTRPLDHDTPVWNPLLSMRIPNRSQLENSLTVFLLKKHHSTMYTLLYVPEQSLPVQLGSHIHWHVFSFRVPPLLHVSSHSANIGFINKNTVVFNKL